MDQRTEMYTEQLRLYRDAVEKISGKTVAKAVLVFLTAKETRTVLTRN